MTPAKRALIDRLWHGHDPLQTYVVSPHEPDAQGWNSSHPYLIEAASEVGSEIIVEIGVWKGGSVLTMARQMKALGSQGVVLAVDTWLGSWEHWLASPGHFGFNNEDDLGFDRGRQRLYDKFMANVLREGVQDYVVPLPLDSNNASCVFKHLGLNCAAMHLDGGHDYEAVKADLHNWWPSIRSGGVLVADDYDTNGGWPDVRRAVDELAQSPEVASFKHEGGKALLRKL